MTSIRFLASSVLAAALVSCASQQADQYDTGNAYANTDPIPAQPAADTPAPNPVYDTPPAYEESSATPGAAAAAASIPDAATPLPTAHTATAPPAASGNGAATIHTVVKGDTLSGLSKKYKVPSASIKQANRMTNDTVVLGKKMVIPPH